MGPRTNPANSRDDQKSQGPGMNNHWTKKMTHVDQKDRTYCGLQKQLSIPQVNTGNLMDIFCSNPVSKK